MAYMDEDEAAGADIWDKIMMRRRAQQLPADPDDGRVYTAGAKASVQPQAPVPSQRPKVQTQPPMIDDSMRPPPPAAPPHEGRRDWWMNKKAPPQWQRGDTRAPERWTGQDKSLNPHDDPREQKRLLDGAYQAGRNGDVGAMEGFPPTPFGRRLRAAYAQGQRDAAQQAGR